MTAGGRTPKHATVARRALVELAPQWRRGAGEWSLLSRTLLGVAAAWDDVERDAAPRAVAAISARYLVVIDRLVAGCGIAPAGPNLEANDGVDDELEAAGWGDLAGELRAGEVGAGE